MIRRNNNEVTVVKYNNKTITKIVTFGRLIWQAVRACFSTQGWVNKAGWFNSDGWNN